MSDKGNSHHSGDSEIIPQGTSHREKPKSFIDAISKIQEWYVMEKNGSPVPKEFFTIKGSLEFYAIGFKGAFVSGVVSILMTPFLMAVVEKYIPIFGATEPSLFDRIFTLGLTFSFTIGYACLVGGLGKYWVGEMTKTAIKHLMTGFSGATLGKLFLAIIVYNTVYIRLLDKDGLAQLLLKLYPMIKYDTLNNIYQWLMGFKPFIMMAQAVVVISSLLLVLVPLSTIWCLARRTRRQLDHERKWR